MSADGCEVERAVLPISRVPAEKCLRHGGIGKRNTSDVLLVQQRSTPCSMTSKRPLRSIPCLSVLIPFVFSFMMSFWYFFGCGDQCESAGRISCSQVQRGRPRQAIHVFCLYCAFRGQMLAMISRSLLLSPRFPLAVGAVSRTTSSISFCSTSCALCQMIWLRQS